MSLVIPRFYSRRGLRVARPARGVGFPGRGRGLPRQAKIVTGARCCNPAPVRLTGLAVVVALSLAACARGCPARTADAPVAVPQPVAAPQIGGRLALTGKAGERDLSLLVQPAQGGVEGVYRLGTLGPIPLRGTLQGAHLRLEETAAVIGPSAAVLEGELSAAGKLRGTLRRQDAATVPLAAGPRAQLTGPAEQALAFVAIRGDGVQLRGQLAADGDTLHGLWSERGADDVQLLSGRMDAASGAFTLEARGSHGSIGRGEGMFLDAAFALGRWTSADAAAPTSFSLERVAELPAVIELAEGRRIVARWRRERHPAGCLVDSVWPHFVGIPPSAAERFDRALDQGRQAVDQRCEATPDAPPPTRATTYRAGTRTPRAIALELVTTSYEGGAHGGSGLSCVVAELESGRVVSPISLVTQSGRETLAALVTAELRRERNAPDLAKAGFFSDPLPLDGAELCLREGAAFVVYRSYAVAPYSAGQPWARLPAAAVRPLLARDPAVDLLLEEK